MVFANSIKIFSSNAVESLMTKYLLFIIVFMLSFMIDISVSRGETVKNIKTNDLDVYYQKTEVFRKWNEKGTDITENENKLLLLDPEQIINPQQMIKKKETKSLPVVEVKETKVIRILAQGAIKLKTPETSEKRSSFVADTILNSSFKPSIPEQEKKLLLSHPERMIKPQQMIKKKEIKSQPTAQASKVIIIRNFAQSVVNLEPPEVRKKATTVADSLLISSFKPLKIKKKLQIAEKEDKTLIYGNDFERDCYLNKKDCGFSMLKEVKQYRKKISPQKENVDTTRFPIDLQAN